MKEKVKEFLFNLFIILTLASFVVIMISGAIYMILDFIRTF